MFNNYMGSIKWLSVVYDTFRLGFIQNEFCSLIWIFIVKCGGLCKCVCMLLSVCEI
jgi:hypothetical protein